MSTGAPPSRAFVTEAQTIVGERHVLTGQGDTASYAEDWTHRWRGDTPAVVRPASTGEVAELVAAARRHSAALVPQGGNTGLVGGGVPHRGEVVLSLRRLDDLEPVDRLAAQVTAGAGVTLEALQAHVAGSGLAFGIDLAARGTATVGGMVATNAGGTHVVRYGSMRAQVVGVEAVLGTGEVVSRLGGLVKDNTGYDLAQLLCGSEGTLGIVTRVRLALASAPGELAVALLALRSVAEAVELASELRRALPGVQALELMTGDSLRRVGEHLGEPFPLRSTAEAYLLVEVAGGAVRDPADALVAPLGLTGQEAGAAAVLDSAVATTQRDRARLWRYREEHSEVAVALGRERGTVVHKLDVTLPTRELARFCADVLALAEGHWPGSEVLLFGHVGDGNLHVNVIPPAGSDTSGDDGVDDLVLELVVARGGSISAEHGIGVAKKAWLERNRSAAEVDAMRAIKSALDPDHILNPHVLL